MLFIAVRQYVNKFESSVVVRVPEFAIKRALHGLYRVSVIERRKLVLVLFNTSCKSKRLNSMIVNSTLLIFGSLLECLVLPCSFSLKY